MSNSKRKKILLVALGGNALINKKEQGTIAQQFKNLRVPVRQLARLAEQYTIIITHGNGPQVGNLMLQQEHCKSVPGLPLEILVAQTQGQIGYMIESTLDSELMKLDRHHRLHLVSLISYVVVDENDPAFTRPTKPIGPCFTREQAQNLPYPVHQTAKGYRRVVASPAPITIVEKREIKRLVEQDFIVICCGGGGIPVTREKRTFTGVDAVIDKDLASVCLAMEVGVNIFLIATDVPGAALNFAKPGQRFLRKVTAARAQSYLAAGHFEAGSMAPKMEAAIKFRQHGGERAIICSITDIDSAIKGTAGTEIT
ncbi:carbamate kinase [Desulforhopalus singaporensis]|uniref:Carbamate kinase n=1 Tax=Desulforhopalus singaporensis TaxID=91360 RepID=A0A1H0TCU6_9BACT|nr:carbamate kinase [Desulforhopalus singaporensis]SDP51814.1 carbamate kinase [Desulforhopalus singaporensis]